MVKEARDLTGKTFGKLTVIERAQPNKQKRTRWHCECECGNAVVVSDWNLVSGLTKSCGCLRRETASEMHKKSHGEASFNALFSTYKRHANAQNVAFELSEDEFRQLISSDCFYCGSAPSNVFKNKSGNGDLIYNGIDRLDPTKGFVIDNVVPACADCNCAKGTRSVDDFIAWIKRVNNHICAREKESGVDQV